MSADPLVRVDRRPEGYAVVTLDDPDKRNVFTLEMSRQVHAVFDELESDSQISAAVVTGEGRSFSAGGHLGELLENSGPDGMRDIYAGFLRIASTPLATIAAVNGHAVGAGMNVALACDVIMAGTSARFDSRFLQIGIGPGGGHTWRLRNITDLQTTKAMVLFGEVLDGEGAAEAGLAWRCVADDHLLDECGAMAAKAASAPRDLLIATKETIGRTETITDSEGAVVNELDTQVWSMGQPAFTEMVADLQKTIAAKEG